MNNADASSKTRETPGRFPADAVPVDDEAPVEVYEGVSLSPTTLDSLVTWDVSGHARRDQERVSSAAARIPGATHGGH